MVFQVFRQNVSLHGYSHLLEDVEHEVGGLVQLVVVLDVGLLELLLGRQLAGLPDALDDGLSGHAAGLGSEVDALSGALGHVTDTKEKRDNSKT